MKLEDRVEHGNLYDKGLSYMLKSSSEVRNKI